jgi:hypothetical protein
MKTPSGCMSGVPSPPTLAWEKPVFTSVCNGIDAVVKSSPAWAAAAVSSEELRADGLSACVPDGKGGAWLEIQVGDCDETALQRAFHVRGGRVVETAPLVAISTNADGSTAACWTASSLPEASRDARGRYRVTATGVPWPPPKPAAKAAKVAP